MIGLSGKSSSVITVRPPEVVMQPQRLGSFRMTSLSFNRSIIRKMMSEKWSIQRERFELNESGYGDVIYSVSTPDNTYYFVVFSDHLDDTERNDRVIAEKWDVTFALCEGPITDEKLKRLRSGLTRQEAGRGDSQDLVWSRANKSERLFAHVVERLVEGRQPDPHVLAKTGYLLRTTAVYGNGKFGIAAFDKMSGNHAFAGTYRAQLFAVYMIRHFSFELAEHIAQSRNSQAAKLDPEIKRYLGIGNATGLGMVPYLISHPKVIHHWIEMREIALARVLEAFPQDSHYLKLLRLLNKAIQYFAEYPVATVDVFVQPEVIVKELQVVTRFVNEMRVNGTFFGNNCARSWLSLTRYTEEEVSLETQELLNSLLIELYPELVLELEKESVIDEKYDVIPQMSIGRLRELINGPYAWVKRFDFADPAEKMYFWYRSEEKEEPRMGVRGEEPGEERALPINIAERVQNLNQDLELAADQEKVATFVLRYPEHKWIIRRIQSLYPFPYAEIQGNLLAKGLLPVHLLRCKLSFLGAERFDPQSNRWVRVTFYQGAPLVEEIGTEFTDEWFFPAIPKLEAFS